MSSTNPLSPKLLKGALVKLDTFMVVPVPQVVIFQYNPASITRSIALVGPSSGSGDASGGKAATQPMTAQPQPPVETITLALEFDATDALESPESHPVAMLTGVADRIAALEMLLYPNTSGQGLLGDLVASLGGGGTPPPPERLTVPLTFFVWGPGRILPVRVTQFSVEEQEFMTTLYPLRAKVNLSLQILREGDYQADKTNQLSADMAKLAWKFYRTQQQVLAVANIANSVESILGMLPI
jgi:hypothetical protein